MKKQKLTFRAKKYMYAHYIKNGKAIISINVDDVKSFYDQLDADRITLSRSIINFIDNRIDYIPYKYEIIIKFNCPEITEEEKAKIADMLRAHYGLEANERKIDLNINKIKSLILFVMGVFFLGLSSLANRYGFVIKEVLSIAGWVAIWEMVTSVLFDTIKIKLDKYDATKLYNTEIHFITKLLNNDNLNCNKK